MGQYQQWSHFQDIDRRLRETLDALQEELTQLDTQLDSPQLAESLAGNPVISALFAHLAANSNGHASPPENEDNHQNGFSQEAAAQIPSESIETISAALLHWGELPDFGPQEVNPSELRDTLPFLAGDPAEIELLPEDMYTFFEEYAQTDPQLELPWWLRNITITNGDADSGKPIDEESIRTNRLVQRWVERWGRQSQPGAFTPESESEGSSDE